MSGKVQRSEITPEAALAAYQKAGSYRAASEILDCDEKTVKKRIEQIEASIDRYLSALDAADREEGEARQVKVTRLNEKIEALRQRMQRLREMEKAVQAGEVELTVMLAWAQELWSGLWVSWMMGGSAVSTESTRART